MESPPTPGPEPNRLSVQQRRAGTILRLRRGLALAVALAAAAVTVTYFVNHRRSQREQAKAASAIPTLGLHVRQSARGVVISKDTGGKPVFRLFASHAETLRPGGRHVLRDVRFLAYGPNGKHADEISGSEFSYDAAAGEVEALGPVRIQLAARTATSKLGVSAGGSPISVRAADLRFNVKTGLGVIRHGVRFQYLNARGQAGSAVLDSRGGSLHLRGGVQVSWQRPNEPDLVMRADAAVLQRLDASTSHGAAGASARLEAGPAAAEHSTAVDTKLDRSEVEKAGAARITLTGHAVLEAGGESLRANEFQFWMRPNHTLRRFDAFGGLRVIDRGGAAGGGPEVVQVSAGEGHADFEPVGPRHTAVRRLLLQGGASMEQSTSGAERRLSARTLDVAFGPAHRLARVTALGDARLTVTGAQGNRPAGAAAGDSISAPQLVFHFVPRQAAAAVRDGAPAGSGLGIGMAGASRLASIDADAIPVTGTSNGGAGRVILNWTDAGAPVNAEASQVVLRLDPRQQPEEAIARGEVRLRQEVGGQIRRSRSDGLDLRFETGKGRARPQLAEAVETGRVELSQGGQRLWADRAVFTPASGVAEFFAQSESSFTHGQVRVRDGATGFEAPRVRWQQEPGGPGRLTASGGVAFSHSLAAEGAKSSSSQDRSAGHGAPVVITARTLVWTQPAGHAASHTTLAGKGRKDAGALLGLTSVPEGQAVFSGHVRLVQSPNTLQSDRLVLDAQPARLTAAGHVTAAFVADRAQAPMPGLDPPASTASAPAGREGTQLPVRVSAGRLVYEGSARSAVLSGKVELRAGAAVLDAPRLRLRFSGASPGLGPAGGLDAPLAAGGLEQALATGGVRIIDGTRRARAAEAEFDFADRLATLRGGSPSILDAEQGQITGDPLTFSLANDEIQVGSKTGERASGQTAVRK